MSEKSQPLGATQPLAASGVIRGVISLAGSAPTPAPLGLGSDPYCAALPNVDRAVMTNDEGRLENVFVRVLGAASTLPPDEAVRVDQNGCSFRPRVVGAVAGQTVLLTNNDQTLHNTHAIRGKEALFSVIQQFQAKPIEKRFPAADPRIVELRCDVHPWMRGFVFVTDNAHFAVSGKDGTFDLADVPPGELQLEAWHEVYGTQIANVFVESGKTTDIDLTFR